MAVSPNVELDYLVEGQVQGEVSYNSAMNKLDTIVQLNVIDRDLTAPPGGESNGDAYIVGASATGSWTGHDDEVAMYYDGYVFVPQQNGWRVFIVDEAALFVRVSGALQQIPFGSTQVPWDVVIDRSDYSTDALAGAALWDAVDATANASIFVKAGTYDMTGKGDLTQAARQTVFCENNTDVVIEVPDAGQTIYTGNWTRWDNATFDGLTTGGDATDGLVNLGTQASGKVMMNCRVLNSAGKGWVGTTTALTDIGGTDTGGLYNCTAEDCAGDGLFQLYKLVNCTAETNGGSGFNVCFFVDNCHATGHASGTDVGFKSCIILNNCLARNNDYGFGLCEKGSSCVAINSNVNNYNGCLWFSASGSEDATGNGWSVCDHLSACESENDGNFGFGSCDDLSSCTANNATSHGFSGSNHLDACDSTNNGGSGYASCGEVSSSGQSGNTGGATAGTTVAHDTSANMYSISAW